MMYSAERIGKTCCISCVSVGKLMGVHGQADTIKILWYCNMSCILAADGLDTAYYRRSAIVLKSDDFKSSEV